MSIRSSEEKDWILRIIRQIAESIARMREILTRSASGAAGAEIRAEVDQSIGLLLGADAPVLSQLDARSAVQLIGDNERVSMWAQLLDLEADTHEADGLRDKALALRKRAAELRDAAGIAVGDRDGKSPQQ